MRLNQIMIHYSGKELQFTDKMLKNVRIWRIEIEEISGKRSEV